MNEVWAGFRQGFGGYYSEFDGSGPYCIDENGRIALITDPRLITGTTNPRMRTDPAQTSFFEKREFKTFREWDAATTGTYLLRVTAPVNFIVQALGIGAEAGSVRMRPYFGGTPTATFTETLPLIPTNTMTEPPAAYEHQLVLEGGGRRHVNWRCAAGRAASKSGRQLKLRQFDWQRRFRRTGQGARRLLRPAQP